MTAKHNITLAIEPGLLRKARAVAARRGRSVSALLADELRELWESGSGRMSVQVLQEFYVNATRRIATPVAQATAREVVSSYGAWVREPATPSTVTRAIDIVASAEQAGATTLYSENLGAGQSIAGVTIVNPLAGA
ncbi:MAG: PIN domain nuclease [Gammaproteobacteria bacterium]|nr:PIN domain nuclease [Gammaproteobacteria bacterium]